MVNNLNIYRLTPTGSCFNFPEHREANAQGSKGVNPLNQSYSKIPAFNIYLKVKSKLDAKYGI